MKYCWSLSMCAAHFLRDLERARHSSMLGKDELLMNNKSL